LIVIGSRSTLSKVEVLQRFFKIIDDRSWSYVLEESVLSTLPVEDLEKAQVGDAEKLREGKKGKPAISRNPLITDVYNHLG
jgi:hypothetical protein